MGVSMRDYLERQGGIESGVVLTVPYIYTYAFKP
jgi:hypothetical protein